MGDEEAAAKAPTFTLTAKIADMKPEMVVDAKRITQEALNKHQKEDGVGIFMDIASYIKKEIDLAYPSDGKADSGVFHCIVGRNFAGSCTYEAHNVVWFHVNECDMDVLLFKSVDNPYD